MSIIISQIESIQIHQSSPMLVRSGTPKASATPPLQDVKKVKQVPVCKCGLDRQTCSDCSEGYLEIVMSGRSPHFKEVPIETKKVPVCGCGLEKANCDVCSEGYLDVVLQGKPPHFKDVEIPTSDSGQPSKHSRSIVLSATDCSCQVHYQKELSSSLKY